MDKDVGMTLTKVHPLLGLTIACTGVWMSCPPNALSGRFLMNVSKGAKIRNRYNQVAHLTQDTNGKVTNSQLDTTNESQEASPFPAGDHKAHVRYKQTRTKAKQTQDRKNIKDPQKKYRLGMVSKIFYCRA